METLAFSGQDSANLSLEGSWCGNNSEQNEAYVSKEL